MASGDHKLVYGSSAALTFGIASLASSSTLVAGWSSAEISNTSDLILDRLIGGHVAVGTSPTANTFIEIWAIPKMDDSNWPDTFDGTNKAVTVTSRAILQAVGYQLALMLVDSTTSNRVYYFWRSLASALKAQYLPKSFQLFCVHNTGVNLNSTAGNHSTSQTPVYDNVAP